MRGREVCVGVDVLQNDLWSTAQMSCLAVLYWGHWRSTLCQAGAVDAFKLGERLPNDKRPAI